MDEKFLPRKLKIEVMSHVFGVAYRHRELITFRFDQSLRTYKEKKSDWIERERQRNSPGPQRWTSAPASMLLNQFIRHKGDLRMRVTVTWKDEWGGGPTRSFVPMLWFSEQVREDVVNKREFVFRIWTQGGFSSQHEGFRGLVRMKKENIEDRDMILVVDDEPLISDGETPLVPEQLQESEEEEAKWEEELLVLNGEERRGETKEVGEGEMQHTNKEVKGEDNKGMIPSNAEEEDKEASNTCEKGQESQKTDREGEGRPAAPAHAASPEVGVVRRVTTKLLKVTLTVVGVIVVVGAFLPEVPED